MTHKELSEVIRKAENWFRQIPGVTHELIEVFIEEGFLSYDDLTFLKPPKLAVLAAVSEEQAAAIILFADKAAARIKQSDRVRKDASNGGGIER
jgi:N utilization substance protein A